MAKRQRFNVFSLSFLDVMSCGFGAVVLIFLIINHATQEDAKVVNKDRLSEIRLLDYQVQRGEKDLFELLQELDDTRQRLDDAQQRLTSTESTLEKQRDEFSELEDRSLAQVTSLEELRADVESRKEDVEQMRAAEDANDGNRVRAVEGEGDRQYLTGLKVGGKRILIALDASASMLDDTIVNVLRRRNMSDERKRAAPKWQRALRTTEWLTAQLPLDSEFQLIAFNTKPWSLIDNSEDTWVPVEQGRVLQDSMHALNALLPEDGTSLENLFTFIRDMNPLPDNVFLVIDSLPTQGTRAPRNATVTGKARMDFFRSAINNLPRQVPVNVIMFPMEGDPLASAAYWGLSRISGGSFMSPSRDWP